MTTETGHSTVRHIERLLSARVPASLYPQGVMSRFDRHLGGNTIVDGADTSAVNQYLELAAPELDADTFPGQPERCWHSLSPFCTRLPVMLSALCSRRYRLATSRAWRAAAGAGRSAAHSSLVQVERA
jgi:hypothetical protein